MLALLRRVGGDGRDEENPDGAGKSAQRVVPQLALDKLNAAPDKIEGRGGQREAEREAPPRSAGRSERPPPPQKSTAAPPDVGGIHASLKFTGTVSLCVSVIVELMDEAGDVLLILDTAPKQGPLTVDKVWQNGPAAKSKMVHVGDLLLEVDGRDVTSMTVKEAQELIIGPAGSWVELKVQQPSKKYPHMLSLMREPRGSESSRATTARVRSKSPQKTPKSRKDDLEQAKADLRRPLPGLDVGRKHAGDHEGSALKSPTSAASAGGTGKKKKAGRPRETPAEKHDKKDPGEASDMPPTQAAARVPKPSTRAASAHPAVVDTDQRARELKKSPRSVREGYGAGGMSPRDIDMRPYHSLNKAPGHLIDSLERDELLAEVDRLRRQIRDGEGACGQAPLPTPHDAAAQIGLLDGRVRRLQQQLDSKARAQAASVARVAALEDENLALRQGQRRARRAASGSARGDEGAAESEHADDGQELQVAQEALRACKAAAERSAAVAEREREARIAVEADLRVLSSAAPQQLPAALQVRGRVKFSMKT